MQSLNSSNGAEGRQRKQWNGQALKAAFEKAAATLPWTIGYQSVNVDRLACVANASGRLPRELRGTLFRNGPARHERGGERYGHRWDGDGMVQQFRFSDEGVTHLGRYVQTEKYVAECASDRFLVNGFGTTLQTFDQIPRSIETANPANISVVHIGEELLALWEPGSAYRLDPHTLETKGVKTWDQALVGRPFSAHPRVEANGDMWNFGADPISGELTIYHARRDGQLLRSHVLTVERLPPIHDFAVTERFLVFLLPSIALNKDRLLSGSSFAESCGWSPKLGMRVLAVDKRDWSQKYFDLPPGCVFHISNAWEGEDGAIRLEYMRAAEPTSLMAGWSVMRGVYRHYEGARLTAVLLHPEKGIASQRVVGEREAEFPVIEGANVGHRHRHVLCLERGADRDREMPGFEQVALINVDSGQAQRFAYGDDWLVEEHVFARAHGEERARWIVGTAIDLREKQTVLSVFGAHRLSEGPMFQARLAYALPLGLHGTYVSLPY